MPRGWPCCQKRQRSDATQSVGACKLPGMNDLVQRLRDRAYATRAGDPLCEEAAAEIERLRLTDAERVAICLALATFDNDETPDAGQNAEAAAVLHGLLERVR